ncbi:hypothetical protein BY996DRAFT_6470920 [Phakopsora pachyrhizi]|nr:hypothetical protein BY996DRAFT_6470920 [Phakopsora pachyrhizi]
MRIIVTSNKTYKNPIKPDRRSVLKQAKDDKGLSVKTIEARVVEVVDLMMSLFQAAKALPRAGVIWACQPLKATAISRYNQRSKELVSIEKRIRLKSFPAIKTAWWNPVRIEHQSDVDSNRSKEFKTAEEPGTDETNQNQTRSERSLSKGFHGSWERAGLVICLSIAGGQRIGDRSLSQIPADQKTQKNKVLLKMVEREVIDGESQSKAMKLEKQLLLC